MRSRLNQYELDMGRKQTSKNYFLLFSIEQLAVIRNLFSLRSKLAVCISILIVIDANIKDDKYTQINALFQQRVLNDILKMKSNAFRLNKSLQLYIQKSNPCVQSDTLQEIFDIYIFIVRYLVFNVNSFVHDGNIFNMGRYVS